MFKIAQEIQGPKKGGSTQAHAIADPATGHVVVSAEEIKRVSLEYCKTVTYLQPHFWVKLAKIHISIVRCDLHGQDFGLYKLVPTNWVQVEF